MNIDVTASDIVDAIHQLYEDDPATEAQYMVKLCHMDSFDITQMASEARGWLTDMDRCLECGARLEYHHGKEYHPETRDWEPYVEAYCPMCDMDDE